MILERGGRLSSRLCDGFLDGVLVALAAWTVMYEVALVAGIDGWTLTAGWLPVAVAAVGWQLLRAGRRPPGGPPPDEGTSSDVRTVSSDLLLVAGLALAAACGVLVLVDLRDLFWAVWATAFVGATLLLVRRSLGRSRQPYGAEAGVPPWSHLVVVATAAAAGVLALLLNRPNADDIYYVNRSTWVAEWGSLAQDDTMHGPQLHASAFNGGPPVASYEALVGGLAHLLGVSAMGLTYLVVPPLASFLLVWALWRLSSAWAPRRPLLVWAGAVAFIVMSGASMVGDFTVPRIWQGKAPAIAVVLPAIWYFATRWLESRDRHALLMLAVCGAAFTGLTSTGILMAPLAAVAILLAGLSLRLAARPLVAAVALLGFPVTVGLVVALASRGVGGDDPRTRPPLNALLTVLGDDGLMVALALVTVVTATLQSRRGVPAALAGASGLVALASLAPGVMTGINAVTGSGPVAWRLALLAPFPVLVGLVLVAPLPRRRGRAESGSPAWAAVVPLVLVVTLVAAGTPVWSDPSTGRHAVGSTPTVKVPLRELAEVRAVLRLPHGDGPVLMPSSHMRVLPIYTTRDFSVVPRARYTRELVGYAGEAEDRLALGRFADGRSAPPSGRLGVVLGRVGVSLACVSRERTEAQLLLEAAGWSRVGGAGRLVCHGPGG